MSEVTIVGGGPAGLVLARVLSAGGADCTVLERDPGRAARPQGGSLDLHVESGQAALAAAGLLDRFWPLARRSGEEIRILGPDGVERVRHAGGTGEPRPEIDRADLRDLLLDSLSDGVMRWGSHVTGVRRGPDGPEVTLSDGTVRRPRLLVGADGAWSRVRPLVTPVEPHDSGISYAELWLRDVARHPELDELVGPGSLWCLGRDLLVGAQRTSRGAARVSVMARRSLPDDRGALLDLLSDWSPRITALLAASDAEVTVRRLAATPAGLTWPSQPDLTVIGDAAHLMPPVGEGANQALLDGAELGRHLLTHDDPATAIATFEAEMLARVRPVHEESDQIQATILSPDALAAMTRFFTAA